MATIVCPLYIYLLFIILFQADSDHSGSELKMYLPPCKLEKIYMNYGRMKNLLVTILLGFFPLVERWGREREKRYQKHHGLFLFFPGVIEINLLVH